MVESKGCRDIEMVETIYMGGPFQMIETVEIVGTLQIIETV